VSGIVDLPLSMFRVAASVVVLVKAGLAGAETDERAKDTAATAGVGRQRRSPRGRTRGEGCPDPGKRRDGKRELACPASTRR
jgi:hypothetical protein